MKLFYAAIILAFSVMNSSCGGNSHEKNGSELLVSITISPSTATAYIGETTQFTAIGAYSDGTTSDLSSSALWSSDNTGSASTGSIGSVLALSSGNSVITANIGNISGSASFSVNTVSLISLSLSSASSSLQTSSTCKITAKGTYSDSHTADVSSAVSWLSENPSIVSINSSGIATGISSGSVVIKASLGTISAETTLSITALADNDNLLMGNPSSAVTDVNKPDNYLLVKTQYALGYSSSKLTPIWTSWHLGSSDLGSTSRQDDFRADTTLPSNWYRVTESDFQYSIYGFDRGHMCPSADRTSSTANNSATFLMTNMIPQAGENNQCAWAALEDYERTLVNAGNELYIISGPAGQGGSTQKGGTMKGIIVNTITTTDGAHYITVPAYTWKIIVVLTAGNNDLSRVTSSTRVIAVKMPNTSDCVTTWGGYRTNVRSLETLTGFDFLSNISKSVQDQIETKTDTGATN